MEDRPNLEKVVRQHVETERFFGGFALRAHKDAGEPIQQEDDMEVAERVAGLENLAYEVRQCLRCDLGSKLGVGVFGGVAVVLDGYRGEHLPGCAMCGHVRLGHKGV